MLCVPKLWIGNLHLSQTSLHGSGRIDASTGVYVLIYHLPLLRVVDFQSYADRSRLGAIGQLCGYVDEAIIVRSDVQRMALEIEVG